MCGGIEEEEEEEEGEVVVVVSNLPVTHSHICLSGRPGSTVLILITEP